MCPKLTKDKVLTISDNLDLLFTHDMIRIVITCTNAEGVQVLGEVWKPVNQDESRAYIR
jgi:hypothetical protein